MKDFYHLCWDCFDKDADHYLETWYKDIAGHSIDCFKCEICGKEPNTSASSTDQSVLTEVSKQRRTG